MATNFPGTQDTTNVPGALLSSNPHSTLHINDRDAIIAIEDKVGTGASNQDASLASLLVGTGANTTEWQTAPSGLTFTSPTIATSLDLNGSELILDADADTSITADTDDQIDIKIVGADDFRFTPNTFAALTGSAIETDTINETTSGNGVTIDSLNVKDGKLNTDDSVQPKHLMTGTGTTWVWQSWTPTFTNLSGGTLNYAKYIQVGKTVHFRLKYTLGGAGVSGSVTATMPTSFNADMIANTEIINGIVYYTDTGTANVFGHMSRNGANSILLLIDLANVTYATADVTSSTKPFTWAINDVISIVGTYEAA